MQYDFNLPANGGSTLDIKGKFFKYKSGTGLLRVRTDKGGFVDLLPGQGVWGVDFSRLMLQDKSGAANSGIVLAGEFDFHDDRISGTVDVVDGGKAKTLANSTFVGSVGVAATAGYNGHVSLWNPAGNTKRVIVSNFVTTLTATAYINVSGMSQRLANLAGNGGSKHIGQAASTAELRYESVSGSASPAYYQTPVPAFCYEIAAGAAFLLPMKEPFILEPGQGVIAYCNSSASLNSSWEWVEESI